MKYFILFITSTLFFYSCSSVKKLGDQNLSHLYNKNNFSLQGEFAAFNLSDSITQIYCNISASNLLFKKSESNAQFSAAFDINYSVYSSLNKNPLVYSGIKSFENIFEGDSLEEIFDSIQIALPFGTDYILELNLYDLNRKSLNTYILTIDKSNKNSRNNFILLSHAEKIPLLGNVISENELFFLRTKGQQNRVEINYFHKNFPIAAPPFDGEFPKLVSSDVDSIFVLDSLESNPIHFDKKGFYHFQTDPSINKEGFTAFNFNSNFPFLKSSQDLIEPLRYITSKEEYQKLVLADNPKSALDNFWLELAGSPDRAKEIISRFYNRVKNANLYFTSYTEGWKTDRGMLFIVFGPPKIVYKYANSETWIYGEENNLVALNFSFFRMKNPYTNNDFQLDRSPIYKSSWYQAVDTWRQGRVY